MRDLWLRLRAVVFRRRVERELDEELAFHQELERRRQLRRGLAPAEAARQAKRRFGPRALIEEQCRDERRVAVVETVVQDARYAARTFLRTPAFTLAAVLTLALGIGANTAMFSLADTALWRELPVSNPETLVALQPRQGSGSTAFGYPHLRELADRQQVLSDLAASGSVGFQTVRLEGVPEPLLEVNGGIVSANYFTLLGVTASAGRLFMARDSASPGTDAVAVMSDGFWSRRFARDPSVVGRTIQLNGTPFTIIGVAARGFFGDRVGVTRDVWIPILMQSRLQSRNLLESRTASWFRLIGRLRDPRDQTRAATELTALFRVIKADEIASGQGSLVNRGTPEDYRIDVEIGTAGLNPQRALFRRPLTILLAAVTVVLLIACLNIASLLMTRAMARQREIGVRLSLGASRARLVRQLVTEIVLLTTAGGLLGLGFMWATAGWFARQMPAETSFDLYLDGRVLAFTAVVCTIATLVCGLVPALEATAGDLTSALRAAGLTPRGGARQHARKTLVVLQVGLSLWLLAGAGLVMRSLWNFRALDIGVDRAHLVTVTVAADSATGASAPADLLRTGLADRLRAVPGVRSVSFSAYGLFSSSMQTAPVRVPDSTVAPAGDPDVRQNYVSPEYFRTVRMTLVRGRTFTEHEAGFDAVVINESTARHYFGDRDPIGRLIYYPRVDEQGRYVPFSEPLDSRQGTPVVGVVGDARYDDLREDPRRMTYLPIRERGGVGLTILALEPGAVATAPQIRQAVNAVDPGLTVRQVAPLEADIDRTLSTERTVANLLGLFGGTALLLAAIGLYGVMAYAVKRRTKEIGIRMALGARRSALVSMVVGDVLALALAGIALGLGAAVSTSSVLESLLFGLEPTDPTTMAAAALLLAGVAALAGAVPARRAASVDPLVALKEE